MTKRDFWRTIKNYFNRKQAVQLGSVLKKSWVLGAVFTISLIAILGANLEPRQVNLQVGQVATRDIQAPRTIIDEAATAKLRQAAEEQALKLIKEDPANYVINREIARAAADQVELVFQVISEALVEMEQPRLGEAGSITEQRTRIAQEAAARIEEISGAQISPWQLVALLDSTQSLPRLQNIAATLLNTYLLSERITPENLGEVREKLERDLADRLNASLPLEPVATIVAGLLRPNLVLDPDAVQRGQEIARQSVEPVRILKGQAIVRRGDVIDQEDLRILRELGLQRGEGGLINFLGIAILTLIMVALLGFFIYQYEPRYIKDESLLALLGLVTVTTTFAAKILSAIPWPGIGYIIPVAFATMLIAILIDARVAVMTAVFLAVVVGVVAGNGDFRFMVVALVGGLTAIFSVSKVSQRSDLMRAGGIVAGVTFFTILGIGLFQYELSVIKQSYLGLVNGIVSSILAIGSLAYLESLFGITSAIKLLELSNPNQPLMKRMLVEAPGTYHHSLMVANMAEAAAEAVNADPLLARVGAYYHDIGKLKRPYFFVENQFAQENPHDKISPSLSTLIITSHVKDGVEMAKEAKLPQVITDIIQQHHGTDLVKYFFHRAQENEKDGTIEEQDFHYTGPKPQTKEAAIVMLADATEAAVRSMQRPTPGRIEAMVRKIIKERLDDGQLDESDLTLKDLDTIANSFVRVLTGIFHARVEYPDKLLKEMEAKKGR